MGKSSKEKLSFALCVGFLTVLVSVSWTWAGEAEPDAVGAIILDTTSFWRCHFTWMLPAVRTEQGIIAIDPVGKMKDPIELSKAEAGDLRIHTPLPPVNWALPDFDDTSWARIPGPFFYDRSGYGGRSGGSSEYLGLLCLRGKFTVKDAGEVKGMTFSVTYRGGVVVYVNGKEVARGHLPQEDLALSTPAQDYPVEAYVSPEGNLLRHGYGDPEKFADRFKLRLRKLSEVPIPVSVLRKGTNVLAVEVHRTLLPDVILEKRQQRSNWATAGIVKLRLTTAEDDAAVPNVVRPQEVQVWNADVSAGIFDQDYGDPNETLAPIKLVGARNGTCSGKVVVSSTRPIKGIRTKVSDLVQPGGKGHIPASRIQVRYGVLGYEPEKRAQSRYPMASRVLRFDGLAQMLPAEMPVITRQPPRHAPADIPSPRFGAVVPVWVTVRVPKEAAPGDYQGHLSIRARGVKTIRVPIELKVLDWAVPDPEDFITHVGLYQSPESVALYYKAPLWSDEHLALMAKSLEQMARVGNKLVIIPLVCRTEEGAEQGIVRWLKQPDGSFKYDFSIMEKYLDLVQKHMGRPKFVTIKVWEVYGYLSKKRPLWIGKPLVSLLNPATGKVEEMEGPRYDSPESLAFWKPVLSQVCSRLEKRGLLDAMLLGQGRDTSPEPPTVTVFNNILPDIRWMRSSHPRVTALKTDTGSVAIGLLEYVWGAGWGRGSIPDPAEAQKYGWRGPAYTTSFPRWPGGSVTVPRITEPVSILRTFAESTVLAGQHGFGRIGADFWPVIADKRGRLVTVAGRYAIAHAAPGPVSISCPAMLHPGPNGAESTPRFEMLVENIQECEARIFIEKALLDFPDKLSQALAQHCQQVLDERTRFIRWCYMNDGATWLWYPSSGWQQRSAKLYSAAAEVAEALGGSGASHLAAQR